MVLIFVIVVELLFMIKVLIFNLLFKKKNKIIFYIIIYILKSDIVFFILEIFVFLYLLCFEVFYRLWLVLWIL